MRQVKQMHPRKRPNPASDVPQSRQIDPIFETISAVNQTGGQPGYGAYVTTPYDNLPDRAFWSRAVVRADTAAMPGLYQPKVRIGRTTALATAGSCFAQHIGTYLRLAGCRLLDAEPAPKPMPDAVAQRFGYGLFSARYGNIYTARQLRELLQEIADDTADPRLVWANSGQFRDALRPTVEPEGLTSAEEVLLHRNCHLERASRMLQQAEVFIFTLGLTEAWIDSATGRTLPLCPGVSGGTFDPARHHLHRFSHAEVLADLHAIRRLLHRFNPAMHLMLTVSPVPLTATASDEHVLTATVSAKSTLRGAAAECTQTHADVDYVPSYEIITQPGAGGPYFTANHRTVSPEGIEKVMAIFLHAHGLLDAEANAPPPTTPDDTENDTHCDETLLEAFAR